MKPPNTETIIYRLKSGLPDELHHLLEQAGRHCLKRGESLYIAGGMVRDLLLCLPGKDIDLVVEGDSHSLAIELARIFDGEITLHEQFRTAKLSVGGFSIDVATARKEAYSHPGALPTVQAGTIEDDLRRRDFSINSMAISVSGENYGRLIDPLGGFADLEGRLVRILHPASFTDDPTRIFRAIRYEQRFGFKIETATLKLLEKGKGNISSLSADRLRYEFECIFAEQAPEMALARAYQLSVLGEISEALIFDKTEAKWFEAARGAYSPQAVPFALYMALLNYRLGNEDNNKLIKRLNLPADAAKTVSGISRLKQKQDDLKKADMRPSDIYYLLAGFDPLAIKACAIACPHHIVKKRLELYLTELRHIRPILGGEDLIRLGYSPGPAIGQALLAIQEKRLNGSVSSRQQETELARNLLQDSKPEQ